MYIQGNHKSSQHNEYKYNIPKYISYIHQILTENKAFIVKHVTTSYFRSQRTIYLN